MTIHLTATHTAQYDTDAHLNDADAIMKIAELEARLTTAAGPRSNRGAPRKHGQYTAHGFACAMYELVAAGTSYTYKAMYDALWFRYSDEQMNIIGLGALRTPDRLIAMRPATTDAAAIRRAKLASEAEYQRMWDAFNYFYAPMDDTPLTANHSRRNRPTKADVATAAQSPDLAPRTTLKREIVNAIIHASLVHENNKRHPGTSIHEGLLVDHEGHIAVDETHIVVGLGDLAPNIAPGNFTARRHAHSRPHKGLAPAVIGLSLGVAAARGTQAHAVPDLCLAADIHHPTGGLSEAAINIVDAIESNGLRAPRSSNRKQYIVVDGGYKGPTLNRDAHARSYGLVTTYAKNRTTLYEVGAVKHDDGTRTPGALLYRGSCLCPGSSRAQLERLELQLPGSDPGSELTVRTPSVRELATHDELEQSLKALKMTTSGRPREATNRKRGGQGKHAEPAETVMQVTVTCPAVKGTARCEIFGDFDDPDLAHLPAVPDAPVDLPFDRRPACCNNDSGEMRLNIPLDAFKTWQDFMPGTWEHAHWYRGPRSANERYNSILKRPNGGADLSRGAIGPRKAAPFAMLLAMTIAVSNRITVETWYAALAFNYGRKPVPPAHAQIKDREAALRAHRKRQADRRV